tara:strand:+ start:399 stop:1322 length:924 start_codon:yes stop_codon:yes gene_type:complete
MSITLTANANMHGLCNRLKFAASVKALADFCGRKFILKWDGFSNFWENELFPVPDGYKSCNIIKKATWRVVDGIEQHRRTRTIKKLNAWAHNASIKNLYATGGYGFVPEGMSIVDYNNAKSEFYKSLIPTDTVKAAINSAPFTVDKKTLGLQIRVSKKSYDRIKGEDYRPSWEFDLGKWVATIKDLSGSFDSIFITTNDLSVVLAIESALDGAISVNFFDREDTERVGGNIWGKVGSELNSLIMDLAEWYMLSNCGKIIYSYGSSFGYEACFISKLSSSIEQPPSNDAYGCNTHWGANHYPLIFNYQ